MMRDTLLAMILTMVGVLCGIRAALGGIRLDAQECVLVVGVVLVTVGCVKLFQTLEGGSNDEF